MINYQKSVSHSDEKKNIYKINFNFFIRISQI